MSRQGVAMDAQAGCLSVGLAWHPHSSQTPGTVQLVTASADKTARLFSREGKQLGTLQVSHWFPSFVQGAWVCYLAELLHNFAERPNIFLLCAPTAR